MSFVWIMNLWRWISRLWKRSPDPVQTYVPEIQMMTAPSAPADLPSFEPTKQEPYRYPRKHHSLIAYRRRLERRRLARIEAARAAKGNS